MRIFQSSVVLLPKGCEFLRVPWRPEGCEASDKKLRILSTRQLKSEDGYLSLSEFASWELSEVCAVLSKSASFQMLYCILRSMRSSLQQLHRRQLLKLFALWLLTINSDAALVSSAFRIIQCSNCTSPWLLSVRPFGFCVLRMIHLPHHKYDTQTTQKILLEEYRLDLFTVFALPVKNSSKVYGKSDCS
jgi:hypothetical protein